MTFKGPMKLIVIFDFLLLIVAIGINASHPRNHPQTPKPIIDHTWATRRWTVEPSTVTFTAPNQPQNLEICMDTLHLTGLGLNRIGDKFIRSSNVRVLHLDDNSLTEISCGAFDGMPKLEILNLSKNYIPVSNFFWLGKLSYLRELTLDDNKRDRYRNETLERFMSPMPSLHRLSLRNDSISSFRVNLKDFAPQLQHLDLSGNVLKDAKFLKNVSPTLKKLILDGNNVNGIPEVQLDKLIEMSASGNNLISVCGSDCADNPVRLIGMPSLEKLNLSRNNIQEISKDSFGMTQKLKVLDLSENKISKLPMRLFDGPRMMEELYLRKNELTSVPDVCTISFLKILDLSGNKLSAIEEKNFCPSMMYLHTLLLNDNSIINVHGHFTGNLQRLHTLDFSRNKISNIPEKLITNSKLEMLLMRGNDIRDLNSLRGESSHTLRELHLQENPLYTINLTQWHCELLPNVVLHLNDRPKLVSKPKAVDQCGIITSTTTAEPDNDVSSYWD